MSDPIVAAAAQALARSASAPNVDALLQIMSFAGSSDDARELGELIGSISSPQAESALIYAANGNNLAANPEVRIAAVRALANFPTPESLLVLRQLEHDPNPALQAASKEIAKQIQEVLRP